MLIRKRKICLPNDIDNIQTSSFVDHQEYKSPILGSNIPIDWEPKKSLTSHMRFSLDVEFR